MRGRGAKPGLVSLVAALVTALLLLGWRVVAGVLRKRTG